VNSEQSGKRVNVLDLVRYFLRLGVSGFGGPVALCGQMERELVEDRKWLTRDEMREGIAVCQSLPGPLAIQVGDDHGKARRFDRARRDRWLAKGG
jgi:chromate transporter